ICLIINNLCIKHHSTFLHFIPIVAVFLTRTQVQMFAMTMWCMFRKIYAPQHAVIAKGVSEWSVEAILNASLIIK
ncbi:hypothetical protein, partial [Haoranjiania flava]